MSCFRTCFLFSLFSLLPLKLLYCVWIVFFLFERTVWKWIQYLEQQFKETKPLLPLFYILFWTCFSFNFSLMKNWRLMYREIGNDFIIMLNFSLPLILLKSYVSIQNISLNSDCLLKIYWTKSLFVIWNVIAKHLILKLTRYIKEHTSYELSSVFKHHS